MQIVKTTRSYHPNLGLLDSAKAKVINTKRSTFESFVMSELKKLLPDYDYEDEDIEEIITEVFNSENHSYSGDVFIEYYKEQNYLRFEVEEEYFIEYYLT